MVRHARRADGVGGVLDRTPRRRRDSVGDVGVAVGVRVPEGSAQQARDLIQLEFRILPIFPA
nr:unnamed protein product [Digitaria exilis]